MLGAFGATCCCGKYGKFEVAIEPWKKGEWATIKTKWRNKMEELMHLFLLRKSRFNDVVKEAKQISLHYLNKYKSNLNWSNKILK